MTESAKDVRSKVFPANLSAFARQSAEGLLRKYA
jgi:hypothetical protein